MIRRPAFGLILLILGSVTSNAQETPTEAEIGTIEVLETEEAALADIFPDADSARSRLITVDSAMRAALHNRLGWIPADSAFLYFDLFMDGGCIGNAVIAEEKGKYRPITFMAGVDTTLRIVDVRVLVYRESRGGEVRHTRFLKQYRRKSLESPLRINRDIINITGATISVNALNAGVRKALAVVECLRQRRTGEIQ